jgi:hypothetical protein
MVERRGRPRFLLEAAQTVGVAGEIRWQDFDCDFTVEP